MKNIILSLKTTHIGSLPFEDPEKAVDLILEYVDIPAWPQLPKFKNENMLIQFNKDLPGFNKEKEIIDIASSKFEEELVKFYEIYFKIIKKRNLDFLSNFLLSENYAKGFKIFLDKVQTFNFSIVKGQITGPFTLATNLKTQTGEIAIFIEDLKDLIVKFLTIKALAQALELKNISSKVIIFLDEPGLARFGLSSFVTISADMVISMLNEIIEILNEFEILTGIHVCANTSWDIVLDSKANILSFDSFNFYDKLITYKENLKRFIKNENKYLAWGVVPTNNETLKNINLKKIIHKFEFQLTNLPSLLDISEEEILKRSLFTPACGLGSLSDTLSIKALNLLKSFKSFIIGGKK